MNPKAAIVLLTLAVLSPCISAAEMVFADGAEVAGRSTPLVIAFPDVSSGPGRAPLPAAVPIPYPNPSIIGDVERGGTAARGIVLRVPRFAQEQNEEDCESAPIERQHSGRAYFEHYTFDVKMERPAAVRHLDLMTHNHQ